MPGHYRWGLIESSGKEATLTQALWRIWMFLARLRRGGYKRLLRVLIPLLGYRARPDVKLARLGSQYGGWHVPVNVLTPDSVCYCVGVGTDASFDLALTQTFGCHVYSFDPTPDSVIYMRDLPCDRNLLGFHPVGIWSENTELQLFAPPPGLAASHSLFDLHGSRTAVSVPCKTLATIMKELGHMRLDLLKIDIEGAWHTVLSNILDENIPIGILCVEFDSPTGLRKLRGMLDRLAGCGFSLVHVVREDYVFMHTRLLQAKPV